MFIFGLVLGSAVLLILQAQGWATGTPLAVGYSFLANLFYLPSFAGLSICNMSTTQIVTGEIFPANPPAWSLLFEVVASLFFLLIFRWKARTLLGWALAFLLIFVASGVTVAYIFDHDHRFSSSIGWGESNFLGGIPRVLFSFITGVFLHRVWAHFSARSSLSWTPLLSKYHGLLYVALVLMLSFPHDLKGGYPLAIVLIGSPLLLLAGSFVQCTGAISRRVAQFLGWISYPLYCVHYPIGRVIFMLANRESFSPRLVMLISAVLSLAVATLIGRAFDEPLRQLLTVRAKRFFAKPARGDATEVTPAQ
jgi:peptidoglycan/LPS O-acetylase OafA/YrhL